MSVFADVGARGRNEVWEVDIDAYDILQWFQIMRSMSTACLSLKTALRRAGPHLHLYSKRLSGATSKISRLLDEGRVAAVDEDFLRKYPELNDGTFLRGVYDLTEAWPRRNRDERDFEHEGPTKLIQSFIDYYAGVVPRLQGALRKFDRSRVILEFTRQTRLRLSAGDLLLPALRHVQKSGLKKYPIFGPGVGRLCDEVETGALFSQAISPHTSVFPMWYIREVLTYEGEGHGSYVKVFDRLLGKGDSRFSY